jgi:YgiT-type zinc finger domain-containing protein
MICLVCRLAEIVERLTSVKFERGEAQVVIKNVPARVCRSCGETYVDEAVAVQLLKSAAGASKAGILNDVIEYNSFN